MDDIAKEIIPINIEEELKNSYMEYAMSVIVGRALPDARDGLKPVHRRTLFAMDVLNNNWNLAHKKSARIVGDVIGKYHPHGDGAVYETIVRMAQDFALRYPLVDGQGNFGSMDGDGAAAMRYTEVRMAKITQELLADLNKNTVDFVENYDGTELIPDVLPTKIPNLLVNGSAGIAVGMATNMLPHNLTESIDASLALLENPSIEIDELMKIIPGPDFPTGGIINGSSGLVDAAKTGKGRIVLRAKAEIETDSKDKSKIIISEIPYQQNKARLVEKIAQLARDKKVEGMSEIRDESDKEGVRIVIEIKSGQNPEVILNNLYSLTPLESAFGVNNVALVNKTPKLLNLKDLLEIFISHRRTVVSRRTEFELNKAKDRGHILEGLAVSLANIDQVIDLIKKSKDPQTAKEKLLAKKWKAGVVSKLIKKAGSITTKPDFLSSDFGLSASLYKLSPIQAQAILDLRLQKLTGLEQDNLVKEYEEILDEIKNLQKILEDPSELKRVIKEELNEIKETYGDERKTPIEERLDLSTEDLIKPEDMVVTISHAGYAKTQPLEVYQSQRRGGVGKAAASVKEDDFVEQLIVANTHRTLLCFSNLGKVYWLKVYEIPQASRVAKGRPLVNLIQLDESERITSLLNVETFDAEGFVFMATKNGVVKKTPIGDFKLPRKSGKRAIKLDNSDELVGTAITNGSNNLMLISDAGKAVYFNEKDARPMGRDTRGVKGITLEEKQSVIALIMPNKDNEILTVSENGYGKRSKVEDFRKTKRGAKGVIAMQLSERNGKLISANQVSEEDQVILISNKGTLVRTKVSEISVIGRNTQGVKVIKLKASEKLNGMALALENDREN
ncbi:DNA gyrase subunit A [SAR86 cluster bacterium]|nr:DNA gyrase subunit A [SAR86 cluster bacterium]